MNEVIIDLLDYHQINSSWRVECGACAEMCSEDAIVYNGNENTLYDKYFEFEDSELLPVYDDYGL